MKLSFSTRGWSGLNWEDTVAVAAEMGFGGIEVYNLPKFDPMLDRSGPFHKYNVASTVRQLKEKKLSIPCFDTSCDISDDADCLAFLQTLMEAARNARVPYVAVVALTENEATVKENLSKLYEIPFNILVFSIDSSFIFRLFKA
jgi:sugar phosphate isomerase/epimerase